MSTKCTDAKFELLDSIKHNTISYPVTINYMKLSLEPDFNNKTIHCIEDMELQCLDSLHESVVKLDSADLDIKKILYRDSENIEPTDELPFLYTADEKLIIKLPKTMKKDSHFFLKIEYRAAPKRGFHFITPDRYHPDKEPQAWTQGEETESKFWFPCIDDPQVRFPREISVSVPNEFIVISNGKLQEVSSTAKEQKKIYTWKETNPDPAYLTSIIVGKFAEIIEHYERQIDLLYYVPVNKRDRVEKSFKGTANMIRFFESYFDILYPYTNYTQTTVQDFEDGGMENTSCTTLPDEMLLDKKAAIDDYPATLSNSARSVVTHELAHQWFGDLVTCKDWSHIWLNEGFATYCEALYIEHIDGKDQFQRYMEAKSLSYFDEACNDYRRPIVTDKYKYPADLFDSHSYSKGAWVLHMLRNTISNDKFKTGLTKYLQQFKNHDVETSDLRNIMEQVSGQNLEHFFRQWIYTEGHPELAVEFIAKENLLRITQLRRPFFEFKLDVKVAYSNSKSSKTFEFTIKHQERNDFKIAISDQNTKLNDIEWFSIDPDFKILKEIKSMKVPPLMILNQITNGNTIIERRQALDAIDYKQVSEQNLEDKLIQILKDKIINDGYFGVSTKAAGKLGEVKSKKALDALFECIDSEVIKNRPNGEGYAVIRWIVNAMGGYIGKLDGYRNADIYNRLEHIVRNGAKSYYVENEALQSLGQYLDERSFLILSEAVEKPNTFNDIIPTAAIVGLSKYSDVLKKIQSNKLKDDEKLDLELLYKKAVDILIRKAQKWNSNNVRTYAVDNLKAFLLDDKHEIRKNIFKVILDALDDSWLEVRKKALAILEQTFSPDDVIFEPEFIDKVKNKLQKMVETDSRDDVKRTAELCLLSIRGKHVEKMRSILKTKEEMAEYVSKKVEIRTKRTFGTSLTLRHS